MTHIPLHGGSGPGEEHHPGTSGEGESGSGEDIDPIDPGEEVVVVEASEDFSHRGWREPPIRVRRIRR
jgi:hypothetical protein